LIDGCTPQITILHRARVVEAQDDLVAVVGVELGAGARAEAIYM
jgi:hypothetical protein